jgi:hypothetical protein
MIYIQMFFDKLKQLFNKILFHIKCSFKSSCCISTHENKDEHKDILGAIKRQNIYIDG